MAIDKGNVSAKYYLTEIYKYKEKGKDDLVEKLYIEIIENNDFYDREVLDDIRYFFQNKSKKYDLMKKCYLKIINTEQSIFDKYEAMMNFADFYYKIEKNYELASYYYSEISIGYYEIFDDYVRREIENSEVEPLIIDKICKYVYQKKTNGYWYEIVSYIFSYLSRTLNDSKNNISDDVNKFLMYISKIIYSEKEGESKRGESKRGELKKEMNEKNKKIINEIIGKIPIKINSETSEKSIDTLELLKIKYIEYLDHKYKPEGKGYTHAKKDFEKRSGTKEQQNKN
jgi:hypothetical protein